MKKDKTDVKKEKGQSAQPAQEGFVMRVFSFFNQYNKIIYGVAIGLLLLVAALMAFNKFYIVPQNEKASSLMTAPIDFMMKADSLSLVKALEGDDENEGFLNIASSFMFTSTSNTAKYFSGLCYLKLGNKEEALRYFLKFKKKDAIYWYAAQAMISDLYDDQGELGKAIKYCKKAAESKDPYFAPVNLFKLGQFFEREENWKKAMDAYQTIQDKYYAEYQKMNIDKYLERARINMNK
jgi:tetratricopeptide (TPR) repeat protein